MTWFLGEEAIRKHRSSPSPRLAIVAPTLPRPTSPARVISAVRKCYTRPQRTLLHPATVQGIGVLTGNKVRLRFLPASVSTGIVFLRTDLPGRPRIPAHIGNVTGTARRTTLGHAPVQVMLVEHVLSALAGLRVDNCIIEIDSVEPPGLDGSCLAFARALLAAGIHNQSANRGVWSVTEPVTVSAGKATLTLHPPDSLDRPEFRLTYFLDYGPNCSIGRQCYTRSVTPGIFLSEIAPCRTFLLEAEVAEIRRQGYGACATTADVLLFGPHGPIDNRLRFANEPARHKTLDMIGDLSLLGADLCGHLIACRSGHPLNVELARVLNRRLIHALGKMAAA